jgi:ribosomal protein L37AE/L43A
MATTENSTIWICTDCLIMLANDEAPTAPTDYPPLGMLRGDETLTLGIDTADHVCVDDGDRENPTDCECEVRNYVALGCPTCHNPDTGERHGATIWYDREI